MRRAVRVLEYGDYCALAGTLLADLGAAVICVNRDEPVRETYWTRGKRSLPLATASSHQVMQRLVDWSDILLLSFEEGADGFASRANDLGAANDTPRVLVRGRVTAEARPTTDLTAWAASGLLHLTGFPHRPPTRFAGSQSHVVVGYNAAIAALAILSASDAERPREIEVRIQEACILVGSEKGVSTYLDDGLRRRRDGQSQLRPAHGFFLATDGQVSLNVYSDIQWDALARWMAQLGAEELLKPGDFAGDAQSRYQMTDVINDWISRATAGRTVDELFRSGQAVGVPITPVLTLEQFAEDAIFDLRRGIDLGPSGRRQVRSPFRECGIGDVLGGGWPATEDPLDHPSA